MSDLPPTAADSQGPTPEQLPHYVPSHSPPGPESGARWSGLLAFTTRRPVAVLMVVVAVLVFGVVSMNSLPLELMPRFNYPRLTIETDYPTASPEQVESEISEALEDGLGSISNLRAKSSISRAEKSEVILEFQWGTDMAQAATEVRQKLDRVRLPSDASSPLLLRYDPTLEPIVRIALTYDETAMGESAGVVDELQRRLELRRIAEQVVKPELQKLAGVAAVNVLGGAEPHVHITVRENRLSQHGLDLAQIAELLRAQNIEQAAGLIEEGKREFLVRTMNRFRSVNEIGLLQVKPGVPLSTIADIELAEKDPEVKTRLDGRPSVEIEILKEADANIVDLSRGVWQKLYGDAQWRKLRGARGRLLFQRPENDRPETHVESGRRGGLVSEDNLPLAQLLPPQVPVVVLSDQSFFIEDAINEVWWSAMFGGVLAVLVLFAFLRQLSKTLIVGLAIPISVVATFTPMNMGNISLNLMSFGGLALGIGMLVDNAIVVLESIARCRDEGDDPFRAAVRGVSEVFGAIVASTLTTVAVFGPVVFVTGIAGQIFGQQALTVVFSLLVSLLVAVFVIPTLAAMNLDLKGGTGRNPREVMRPRFIDDARRWWHNLRSGEFFRPLLELLGMRPKSPTPTATDLPPQPPPTPLQKLLSEAGKGLGLPFVAAWCVLRPILGGIEVLAIAAVEFFWRYLMLVPALMVVMATQIGFGIAYKFGILVLHRPANAFDRSFTAFTDFYRRVLGRALAHTNSVVAGIVVLGAITAVVFPLLDSELIPRLKQGEFFAEFTLAEGQPLASTDAAMLGIEDVFADAEIVDAIERHTLIVGESRTSSGEKVRRENLARLTVVLKRGTDSAAEERVKEKIRELQGQSPALRPPTFSVPTLFTLQTPLAVEVQGRSLENIRDAAQEIEAAMRAMTTADGKPFFEDVRSSVRRGNPEILIQFDRDVLERYGLRAQQASATLKRKLEGDVPTTFTLEDRRIDVRVELSQFDKPTIERMLDLKLTESLTVREAADYVFVEGPAEIRRMDNRRTALVSATPARGVALSDAETRVREMLATEDFGAPTVKISGETDERRESLNSLFGALALAIFLVYVVMASQFESLVQPFIILLTVPLALIGVVLTLFVLGLPISVVVIVGVIVLAGIVVNNAIVLIDRINYNRAQGMPLDEAILDAGTVRLRPILMTTLTTVLGLLPLTGWLNFLIEWTGIFNGEGQEIRAPMAITVIVGLVTSTVLTLVVIPVVYRIFAHLGYKAAAPATASETLAESGGE